MRRLCTLLSLIIIFTSFFTAPFAAASGLTLNLPSSPSISVMAGDTFTIPVTLTSTSARAVTVAGFSGAVAVGEETVSLVANVPKDVNLLAGATSAGIHSVKVEVREGDTLLAASTLIVRVEEPASEPPSVESPLFSVTGVKFTPANPVNLSEPFSVEVEFTNRGNREAQNAFVGFNGGENFEVVDITSRVSLGTVWSGSRRTAVFRIRAKKDRVSNQADIQFTYNNGNARESFTETVNLPLAAVKDPAKTQPPFLKITAFSVEPQERNGDFLLRFSVKNQGSGAARNAAIRLDGSEAFPRGTSNVLYLPRLEAGAVHEFTLKMAVASKDQAVYTIPVQLDYSDADDGSYQGAETMAVRASALGIKEEQEETGWRPRVMLSKYTLSEEQILAGDTVRLTLHIENSSDKVVGNIKFSLGLIPSGNNASDTVFSPVSSSNSGYIDRIAAKRTVVKEILLYVDPNATAKTYSVPVEIEYEDLSGQSYQVSETVNIPVTQESRLQVLSVDVPPMAGLGQPVPISAEFVNVGKVALKNFLVSIEGDFPKENASYFLASFEIGASDFFQGIIIPQGEGLLSGTVVFTYTDNTNKEVRVEQPFELNVENMGGPGMEEPFPPDFYPPTEPSGGRFGGVLPWAALAVLLLVGGGVIFVRKRRAKQGEMFNEDF